MVGSDGWISDAEDILHTIEGLEAVKEVRAAANYWASAEGSMVGDTDWVKEHIEGRVKRAEEWRGRLEDHKELAKASRYIRILGREFRPVSISDVNPCGHLRDEANDEEIKSCDDLKDAIAKARSATERKPNADKPEHRVQAFLIREAIKNELHLEKVLPGFSDVFDEIIFTTDEFAVKQGREATRCRADIVALGGKDGRFFPVFIELKNERLLGKLKRQLDRACNLLWMHNHARDPFRRFLSEVSGVPIDSISRDENAAKKMLIWPKSPSGEEAKGVNDARESGFLVVDFEPAYRFSRRRP